MATKGFRKTAANREAAFRYFRDILCSQNGIEDFSSSGFGWSIYDESFAVDAASPQASDWFVAYSTGEEGKDDLFAQITFAASYFTIKFWVGWNAVSHTGVNTIGSLNIGVAALTDFAFNLYGNKDYFIPMFHDANYLYGFYFGKLDSFYDDTIAVCSSDLTAGSDVSITVDAVPPSWKVGGRIMIKDQADIEIITIKTLDGNTITADLTKSYTANVKLAQTFQLVFPTSSTFTNNFGSMIDHSGARNQAATLYRQTFNTKVDPDKLDDDYIGTYVWLIPADTMAGSLKGLVYVGSNGLTTGDAFIAGDGSTWRYFDLYSGMYCFLKEGDA